MIKITQFISSGKISSKRNSQFLTSWINSTGMNRMNLLAFSKLPILWFYVDHIKKKNVQVDMDECVVTNESVLALRYNASCWTPVSKREGLTNWKGMNTILLLLQLYLISQERFTQTATHRSAYPGWTWPGGQQRGDPEPVMVWGQVEREPEALLQAALPRAALTLRPLGSISAAQCLRLETHNADSNADHLCVISPIPPPLQISAPLFVSNWWKLPFCGD